MHDARQLIELGEEAVKVLQRRGYTLDMARLERLSGARNGAIRLSDELRAESKQVAEQVQRETRAGKDVTELREQARALKDRVGQAGGERDRLDSELRAFLLEIPNLPAQDVPDGNAEEDAVEVRRHGDPPPIAFDVLDHQAIGEAMGLLDFGRATKLAGPRFSVVRGPLAALERALAQFFLHLHTQRHGYVEYSLPYLVTRETMTGTGQLPKFEEDLFATGVGDRELFLIPTAEVPLTNLHAGEILEEGELPLALTSWTPCFRSEAGSYGRDTRGLLRLHQFSKVELVRVCAEPDSRAELERMVGHAETCLQELGLPYRVVALAAGDLGFSATFTYDVEVWLPSQGRYREISSCSDCGSFQARREAMRYRTKQGEKRLPATLNGSALPIGRTLAALLENGQREDGSVRLPDVLTPYLGFDLLSPRGEPLRE